MKEITLKPFYKLPVCELEPIIQESLAEGFTLVKRMKENWEYGSNRFDRLGEIYLGAYINDQLVGVGGINIDPYQLEINVGRLRHLYVLKEFRRLGVAKKIVEYIIEHSGPYFKVIRLRSNDNDQTGNLFYQSMNFKEVNTDKVSHILNL